MHLTLVAANPGTDIEDVELGRSLLLQARQRRVANRARQMRLTFFDRFRVIRRGHRVLAEASIIQLFDVHGNMLARRAGEERRESGTV